MTALPCTAPPTQTDSADRRPPRRLPALLLLAQFACIWAAFFIVLPPPKSKKHLKMTHLPLGLVIGPGPLGLAVAETLLRQGKSVGLPTD